MSHLICSLYSDVLIVLKKVVVFVGWVYIKRLVLFLAFVGIFILWFIMIHALEDVAFEDLLASSLQRVVSTLCCLKLLKFGDQWPQF